MSSDEQDRRRARAQLGDKLYTRTNDETHVVLRKLIDAADGHTLVAVKNAAMLLGLSCAKADGTALASVQKSTRVAWDSSAVRELAQGLQECPHGEQQN